MCVCALRLVWYVNVDSKAAKKRNKKFQLYQTKSWKIVCAQIYEARAPSRCICVQSMILRAFKM